MPEAVSSSGHSQITANSKRAVEHASARNGLIPLVNTSEVRLH